MATPDFDIHAIRSKPLRRVVMIVSMPFLFLFHFLIAPIAAALEAARDEFVVGARSLKGLPEEWRDCWG